MQKAAAYPAARQNRPAPEYTKGEEIFNAVSHIVGGALGLAALITLLIFAYPNAGYMASVAAFGVSVIVLYTMSALYHFLPRGEIVALVGASFRKKSGRRFVRFPMVKPEATVKLQLKLEIRKLIGQLAGQTIKIRL